MGWNYRVIRKSKPHPIKGHKPKVLHWFDMHEVYYRKNGKPYMWTKDPIDANSYESVQEMRDALLAMFLDLIKLPVLKIVGTGKKQKLVPWK